MMPVPAVRVAETAEAEAEGDSEPAVFNGVYCDGCGVNPIVAPRFK